MEFLEHNHSEDFGFRAFVPDGIKFFEPIESFPESSLKLAAIANIKGYFAISDGNILVLDKLDKLHSLAKESEELAFSDAENDDTSQELAYTKFNHITLPYPVTQIAFTADDSTLLFTGSEQQIGYISDLASLTVEQLALNNQLDSEVREFSNCPANGHMALLLTTDNELLLVNTKSGTVKEIKDNVSCFAWSPKGDRLAVGSAETQQISIVKIETPNVAVVTLEKPEGLEDEDPLHIDWLSEDSWLLSYSDSTNDAILVPADDEVPEVKNYWVQNAASSVEVKEVDDICPAFCQTSRCQQFYSTTLHNWSSSNDPAISPLVIVASAFSAEISALACESVITPGADSNRAQLPFNDDLDDDESPLGMFLDLRGTDQVVQPCDRISESDPLPKLWLLTNSGRLIGWDIFYVEAVKSKDVSLSNSMELVKQVYASAVRSPEIKIDASAITLRSEEETRFADLNLGGTGKAATGGIFDSSGSEVKANPFGESSSPFGSTAKTENTVSSQDSKAEEKPKSIFGSSTPAFGQSSFGSTSDKPAFGQSAFGQPTSTPAFGQSAFGQPTSIPAFGQSTFGQPTTTPAFGQSTFGQPTPTPAFGQSAFGSTSAKPAFGQSSFSTPSEPEAISSEASTLAPNPVFGQSTAVGSSKPTGFGTSGFAAFGAPGSAAQTSASPFVTAVSGDSPFKALAAKSTPIFGAGASATESPFSSLSKKSDGPGLSNPTPLFGASDDSPLSSTWGSTGASPFAKFQTESKPANHDKIDSSDEDAISDGSDDNVISKVLEKSKLKSESSFELVESSSISAAKPGISSTQTEESQVFTSTDKSTGRWAAEEIGTSEGSDNASGLEFSEEDQSDASEVDIKKEKDDDFDTDTKQGDASDKPPPVKKAELARAGDVKDAQTQSSVETHDYAIQTAPFTRDQEMQIPRPVTREMSIQTDEIPRLSIPVQSFDDEEVYQSQFRVPPQVPQYLQLGSVKHPKLSSAPLVRILEELYYSTASQVDVLQANVEQIADYLAEHLDDSLIHTWASINYASYWKLGEAKTVKAIVEDQAGFFASVQTKFESLSDSTDRVKASLVEVDERASKLESMLLHWDKSSHLFKQRSLDFDNSSMQKQLRAKTMSVEEQLLKAQEILTILKSRSRFGQNSDTSDTTAGFERLKTAVREVTSAARAKFEDVRQLSKQIEQQEAIYKMAQLASAGTETGNDKLASAFSVIQINDSGSRGHSKAAIGRALRQRSEGSVQTSRVLKKLG